MNILHSIKHRSLRERSKLKHILGLEHGNIPIQLDLWGNEVIFRGNGQTTLYGYPKIRDIN
jgi:hypothetical protein